MSELKEQKLTVHIEKPLTATVAPQMGPSEKWPGVSEDLLVLQKYNWNASIILNLYKMNCTKIFLSSTFNQHIEIICYKIQLLTLRLITPCNLQLRHLRPYDDCMNVVVAAACRRVIMLAGCHINLFLYPVIRYARCLLLFCWQSQHTQQNEWIMVTNCTVIKFRPHN